MFRLIECVVVALAIGSSYGFLDIEGTHTGVYNQSAPSDGYFSSDATSQINSDYGCFAYVGDNGLWQLYGSNVNIEYGSDIYVAYRCSVWGASGLAYGSAVYTKSSVRLIGNSRLMSCTYTGFDVRLSTAQLDGSFFTLYDWSNASIYQSNMQQKNSIVTTGLLNQFNLQGASLTLSSSNITTGQGCQFLMASKSTLLANNLDVQMEDYSAFSMNAGSYLVTMGSSSSIRLGNRAELQIIGNCVFSGDLDVPDRILRVVNLTTADAGFICFPTKVALKVFISKSA